MWDLAQKRHHSYIYIVVRPGGEAPPPAPGALCFRFKRQQILGRSPRNERAQSISLLNSEVRSPFNRNIYNELQKYIAHGISLAVFL